MKKTESIHVTFPLDFEILSADRKSLLSGMQEAFTTQVDRDEVRVKFIPAEPEIVANLSNPSSILSLIIHIPNYYKPLTAYGKARDIEVSNPPQMRMAIELVEMQGKERKLLTEYAKWVKWRPRFLLLLFAIIMILVSSAIGYSYFLMREDLRLRAQIRDADAAREIVQLEIADNIEKRTRLEAAIMALEQRLAEQAETKAPPEKKVVNIKDPAKEKERIELEKKLRAGEDERKRLREQVENLREEMEKLEAQIAAKTEVPPETVTVIFKNGRTITGKLIESDENSIKLKIGYRPITLNRKLIQRVEIAKTKKGKK